MGMGQNNEIKIVVVERQIIAKILENLGVRPAVNKNLMTFGGFNKNRVALTDVVELDVEILIGAAALLVVPVVSLFICLTLVGIPLGLTALFLFAAGVYGGQVFVGSWLGKEVLGPPTGQGQALGQLALGLGLIFVAGEIPYVGTIVSWVVVFWGFGALILSLVDRRQPGAAAI